MSKEVKVKCIGCGEMASQRADGSCTKCGTKSNVEEVGARPKYFTSSALDNYVPFHKPVIVQREAADEIVNIPLSDLVSEANDCVVCSENRKLGRPKCTLCGKWLTSKSAV